MSSRSYPPFFLGVLLPQREGARFRIEVAKLVLLAAIAMLAVSCGAIGTGTGANPTPSSGGIGFDVTATEKDHAATMHAGQKLEVVLHAGSGMVNWSHPVSSDISVLAPIVDSAATAARGVTLAAFEAKKSGEVEVTSMAGPLCPSGAMCPMYAIAYMLKVTITP